MNNDAPQLSIRSAMKARNDLSELPRLTDFLGAFFAQNNLSPDAIGDCELALEEVFVNVVRYGYPEGGSHEIEVSASVEGGVVTLAVEDQGVAFNPLEASLSDLNRPLEERGVGGLGIHLVKGVMDELDYSRNGNRNRLVMRKRVGS